MVGGAGDDDLTGNGSANDLTGNGGDDDLAGGAGTGPDGADVLNGGAHGTATAPNQNGSTGDLADYATRDDDLDVDIGGGANDGGGGCPAGGGCEDDDVQSTIEKIITGDGDDVLAGDSAANNLSAGAGDDTFRGGTGTGPDGADTMSGGTNTAVGDTVTYANRTDAIFILLAIADSAGGRVPRRGLRGRRRQRDRERHGRLGQRPARGQRRRQRLRRRRRR